MGEDGGRFVTERTHQTIEARDREKMEHRADHDRDIAEKMQINKATELAQAAAVPGVHQGGAGEGGMDGRSKASRPERPALEHGVAETDWEILEEAWDRYKRLSRITAVQDCREELWQCLSAGLTQVCMYDRIEKSTTTPRELLDAIKRLAIRKHNILISQVQFLSMGQKREEPRLSYSARLGGKASLCKFMVACHDCEAEVSYTEKIMDYQFVRGLVDPVVQEKILSKALNGTELKLQELIGMVEALEMGKRS
jgi:hypothetical protein